MVKSKEDQAMTSFTEEIKKADGNPFTEFQITVHHELIYPEKNAVVFLTFGLLEGLGELANVHRRIIRGDYAGKGIRGSEKIQEEMVNACAKIALYVAEFVTLTGTTLGHLFNDEDFLDFEESAAVGSEGSKSTTGTYALSIGGSIGEFVNEVSGNITKEDVDLINGFAEDLYTCICQLMILIERPFSDVFSYHRIKVDTGES